MDIFGGHIRRGDTQSPFVVEELFETIGDRGARTTSRSGDIPVEQQILVFGVCSESPSATASFGAAPTDMRADAKRSTISPTTVASSATSSSSTCRNRSPRRWPRRTRTTSSSISPRTSSLPPWTVSRWRVVSSSTISARLAPDDATGHVGHTAGNCVPTAEPGQLCALPRKPLLADRKLQDVQLPSDYPLLEPVANVMPALHSQ